jgi:peptidoglycan hydrolase-like protein with peptidoglycan-binding domain
MAGAGYVMPFSDAGAPETYTRGTPDPYMFREMGTKPSSDGRLYITDSREKATRQVTNRKTHAVTSKVMPAAQLFRNVKGGPPFWIPTADYLPRVVEGPSMGQVLSQAATSVGTPIVSVGKGIASVGYGIAKTVGKMAVSPVSLVSDIAQGKNVLNSFASNIKDNLQNAKELAPYAQAVLSIVPGVGAGVNAAIAAGTALAHGQPITDALVSGLKNMVPGGPIAAQALDTAFKIAKGDNVLSSVLDAARNQVPEGPAKIAFDTGVALAHGQNLQTALIQHGSKLLPGGETVQSAVRQVASGGSVVNALAGAAKEQGMSFFDRQLGPAASRALSRQGPVIGQIRNAAMSVVPANVKQAAQAILQNPSLRSLPISEVSRRLGIPERDVQHAVASVVQAANRTGMGRQVRALAPAHAIADRIGTMTSFDQNLARFGSRMAPIATSHNAIRRLPRFPHLMPGAMGLQDAGAFSTIKLGSTGADVQAWQKIIGVTADGKFGPQTDAATRTWQRSHGLTADGIVGPKTWAAASGGTPTQAPTGQGSFTIPEVVISAAPPPPLTTTQIAAANSMPTIRLGSTGPAVITWQGILRRDSGISGFTIPPDGQFGPMTDAATRAWQNSSGITPDGVVGPQTWTKGIGSLTTAPLPAEKAPGVALPTPAPVGLPPGLPPIPTQPASAPAPIATLPPMPPPGPAPVVLMPSPVGVTTPPPLSAQSDSKAGGAVAALAIGGLIAKVMGIF